MNHIPEISLKVGNGVTAGAEVENFEKFVSQEIFKCSRVFIIVQ